MLDTLIGVRKYLWSVGGENTIIYNRIGVSLSKWYKKYGGRSSKDEGQEAIAP
jgi:hypothetical protein